MLVLDWAGAGPQSGPQAAALLTARMIAIWVVRVDGRHGGAGRGRGAGGAGAPQGFPQHRDTVTGLAFRYGTHELFSASFDRTVKLWSLADRAYIDTLYGHQSEVPPPPPPPHVHSPKLPAALTGIQPSKDSFASLNRNTHIARTPGLPRVRACTSDASGLYANIVCQALS